MTGFEITLVTILFTCIVASGLFSGSETALVAIPKERVHQLAKRSHRGERLATLVDDYERTLGVLLVANNFVNILGASIGTVLAVELLSRVAERSAADAWGPWLSTLVITAVILVVGEITPKTLAARHPDRVAMAVAPLIWWMGVVLKYPARFFIAISRGILRTFGVNGTPSIGATEQDILALAILSEAAGQIDPVEREILESLFELADRPVRDVMTPRLKVAALDQGATQVEVRAAVSRHGHSRFPVVSPGGTLDDVVGVLYVKDLLRSEREGPVDGFLRDPVYVPESTPVLTALQRLRRQRVSFAVVLDEHGGADGIVTIKDLISELVGDLTDEHDPKEPAVVRVNGQIWVVDGRVPVVDVAEEVDIELPEGEYASIAGLFLAESGRIPEAGDSVTINDVEFTVLRMDRRRIDRIRIDTLPETGGDQSD